MAQTSADEPPDVSGPMHAGDAQCGGGPLTHEGRLLARVRTCIWFIPFDELSETDLTRSYGVLWVQNTVDPVGGWCATRVPTEIKISKDAERHARTPSSRVKTRRPRPVTTSLTVDADGHAVENGRVKQSYRLYRRGLTPSLAEDGRIVRSTWKGKESDKLFFAAGAEVSWELFSSAKFKGGLGKLSFVKSRGC